MHTEAHDSTEKVEGAVSSGPPSSAVENLWSAAPAAEADEALVPKQIVRPIIFTCATVQDDWQAPALHEALESTENVEYVDDWGAGLDGPRVR